MSQENVEIVGRMFQALNEGDLDGVLSYWDPRGDYYPIAKWPEAQPRHGSDEIRDFLVNYLQGFDRFEFTVQAIKPIADDRVFMSVRLAWEWKARGMSLDGDLFHCFWVRHGQVFRQEDHVTLPGALRALGLDGETLEAVGLGQ